MADHQKFGELAESYGLGALDAGERAAFEQHLASCPECQRAVADALLVADALPYTLTPVDPPAALRSKLMMAAAPVAPAAAPAMSLRWLAVAAALIAASAGTFAWTEYRRASAAQVAAAQSQAQVEALQGQLTALQTQADTARRAIDILAADDLSRVELKGQAAAPAASGRAYLSPARGLLFSTVGLPPLPEGRVYQLWYVTAAAPLSAALVSPDEAGRFTMIINTPIGVRPSALAMTIEPAGGLPAPSGAFYLLGSF